MIDLALNFLFQILSEIAGGLENHPEFGLKLKAEDVTLGNNDTIALCLMMIIFGK